MSTEGTKHGLNTDAFYEAVMTEKVEFITKPENRHLVCLPLNNVKRICFSYQGLAILPIHLAATYRKVQSLEALLDAGANPELRDQRGRNALHLVITHWPNIVSAWPVPHSKLRVTMETMQQRAEDCLRVLCERGVDLNARVSSDSRQTGLHLAVRYGALPAVGMLASYGANVNLADMIGMMPLHMAAGVLHRDIITCLIELGADCNKAMESSGNTPLHMAVRAEASSFADTQSNSLSCINAILEGGTKLDTVNHEGRTPLHEACSAGRKAVVDVLLSYGADINKLSRRGENCLFLFLEHKPNLNNTQLLGKLLYLTSPFKITNSEGLLPKCLELREYARQRSELINFTQQPRDLQSLCKIRVHQLYGEDDKPTLNELLPQRIVDFVFDYWECPPEIDFTNNENQQPRFQFRPDFIPRHFGTLPPRFNIPPNFSNTQPGFANARPNFVNNPPNFQNIPRNLPNIPRDFPFIPQDFQNILRDFPNIPQDFFDTIQDFRNNPRGAPNPPRGAPNPTRGAPNPARGVPNTPQGAPNPTRDAPNPTRDAPNTPRGVPNTPRGAPNTSQGAQNSAQDVPNTARDVPNISRAFPDMPRVFPGIPAPFPNIPRAFPDIPRVFPGIPYAPFPNMPQRSGFSFSSSDFPNFPDFTNFRDFSNN